MTGASCVEYAHITCFQGDLHYADSCGSVQDEIAQHCKSGCDDSGCLPCAPAPIGRVCSGGNVHEVIGHCDGSISVGAMLEACEHGCVRGACSGSECSPDAGTVCSGGDVYSVDSCGVRGALVEECASGCEMGRCVRPEMPECTCNPRERYPGFECSIGSTRCTGCLGFDDFCDDAEICTPEACASQFTCSDGVLFLDGHPIAKCSLELPFCALVCPGA